MDVRCEGEKARKSVLTESEIGPPNATSLQDENSITCRVFESRDSVPPEDCQTPVL